MDVIAVGNANVDLVATVPKIPIEDEKLVISSLETHPGGSASNFAVGIARQGLRSGFFGFVGADREGNFLIQELSREGIDTSKVARLAQVKTGFAFLVTTTTGEHVSLAYRGANSHLTPERVDIPYLSQSRMVHFSSVTREMLLHSPSICAKAQVKLSIDPGQDALEGSTSETLEALSHADYVFLNRREYYDLLHEHPTPPSVTDFGKTRQGIMSIQLGEEGSIVYDGETTHQIAAFPTTIVDSTGAGDAYTSSFIAATLKGFPPKAAGIYANATAALKCQGKGARGAIPRSDQVQAFLREQKIHLGSDL